MNETHDAGKFLLMQQKIEIKMVTNSWKGIDVCQ